MATRPDARLRDQLPQLEVSRERMGELELLRVRGELDIAHAARLGAAVNDALRAKPAEVVIDLCQVEFVDSTGAAVLLNARRRTLRLGIRLKLACDVPSTLKLLKLTRLDRDFDIYPSVPAALEN